MERSIKKWEEGNPFSAIAIIFKGRVIGHAEIGEGKEPGIARFEIVVESYYARRSFEMERKLPGSSS